MCSSLTTPSIAHLRSLDMNEALVSFRCLLLLCTKIYNNLSSLIYLAKLLVFLQLTLFVSHSFYLALDSSSGLIKLYFVVNILLSLGCSLAEGMVRNKDCVPLPSYHLSKIEEISLSSIFSTKRGAMTHNKEQTAANEEL